MPVALAGTLEIARVISSKNYKPESTIKFILFGAEELMLSSYSGCKYFAEQARKNGTNISMMINLDMIANSADTIKKAPYILIIILEANICLSLQKTVQKYIRG